MSGRFARVPPMNRLPLTLFEQFLFFEDRPSHPYWMVGKFHFIGSLDRGSFEAAWKAAYIRHPLLRAVVRKGRAGNLYWDLGDLRNPVLEWRRGPLESAWPQWRPISLEEEPGIRLLVVEDAATTDVFFQTHHAVFDAVGCFAMIHDILIHYARERGASVKPSELRPELLPDRNRFGLTFWGKLKLAPTQLVGLLVAFDFLRREAAPLIPHEPALAGDKPPAELWAASARRRLNREKFKKLHQAAKTLQVGTNDIYIRDLGAAVAIWREAHRIGSPDDWIRMGIPVGLRRPADRFLPAANVMSIVTLDRRVRSLRNRDRLLRRAREDMDFIKNKRWGYTFLILLALYRILPGGIRRYARAKRCRATLFLSNMGQIFSRSPLRDASHRVAVPGAVLDDIHLAGTLRPATCVNVALVEYAGELLIDLHYDPRVLTEAQGADLLQTFVDQMALSAESAVRPI